MVSIDTSDVYQGQAQLGKAVTNLGVAFGGLADKAGEADEFETERRFQEFKWAEAKALDERMRTIEPGQAAHLPDQWASEYMDKARGFFESVPDRLKPKYDAKLFDTERDYYGTATTFARTEQKRSALQSLDEHKNRVALSTNLEDAYKSYDEMLSVAPLDLIDKDKRRTKDLADITKEHIKWRIANKDNLDEVVEWLKSPEAVPSAVETQNDGMAIVRTGSGAAFRVAGQFADRFAGALADLESAGVDIKGTQSGGFADRSIRGTSAPSQHKFGRAIDINWDENARGTRGKIDAALARSVANKWGLKWGGDWKNPDPMHFEVDSSAKPIGEYKVANAKGQTASDASSAPSRARLPYLSAADRASLLTSAEAAKKTALQSRLWEFKGQLDDDVESRRRTGVGRQGLETEAIQKTVEPSVWNNYLMRAKKADMEFAVTSRMEDMDDHELTDHLNGLVDKHLKPGAGDYDMWADVIEAAEGKAGKLRKLRADDPALAVNDSPEVKAAAVLGTEDAAGLQQVLKARLEAQRRLGIPEMEQRIITKAEAKALLDMPSTASEGEEIRRFRAAAVRAEQQYGRLGAKAFEAALAFHFRERKLSEEAAGLMAKMARGEPITRKDQRSAEELSRIGQAEKAFSPSATQSTVSPVKRTPTKEAIDLLLANPALAPQFDAKYGAGSAASVLAKR